MISVAAHFFHEWFSPHRPQSASGCKSFYLKASDIGAFSHFEQEMVKKRNVDAHFFGQDFKYMKIIKFTNKKNAKVRTTVMRNGTNQKENIRCSTNDVNT